MPLSNLASPMAILTANSPFRGGEREESSSSSDAFAPFSHCVEGGNLSLKFAIVAQCVFRSRQGHKLLRPLSNNTKSSSQCVNCLIFLHTVTTALSDCPMNHFTWQLYIHKYHNVISYYSSIRQGVDTHPCLVTIYRLFTDTGQEVSAPNVSTHTIDTSCHTSCP